MSAEKARELAIVLRTLRDERIERTRNPLNGAVSADETAVALDEAFRHFIDLADRA